MFTGWAGGFGLFPNKARQGGGHQLKLYTIAVGSNAHNGVVCSGIRVIYGISSSFIVALLQKLRNNAVTSKSSRPISFARDPVCFRIRAVWGEGYFNAVPTKMRPDIEWPAPVRSVVNKSELWIRAFQGA